MCSSHLVTRFSSELNNQKRGKRKGNMLTSSLSLAMAAVPWRLKELQKQAGIYDPSQPVFRFASRAYLTPTRLNKILSISLSDLCAPGVNTIFCHSIRARISSKLSLLPDLVSSDMIKGWGSWHSECYIRYTKLQLPQRENIFSRIATALRTVQNDATLTRHI